MAKAKPSVVQRRTKSPSHKLPFPADTGTTRLTEATAAVIAEQDICQEDMLGYYWMDGH